MLLHSNTQLSTALFEAAETSQLRVVAKRGVGGVYGGASGSGMAQMGVDAYDLSRSTVLAATRVPKRR